MIVPRSVADETKALTDILIALANNLRPEDNFYCKVLGPIVTAGVANTEFTVTHNLGRVPINYIWNVDQAVTVYDSRRNLWTAQVMYLKCSGASANLYIIVF